MFLVCITALTVLPQGGVVTVRFDRDVAEAAFLQRVAPGGYKRAEFGPKVFPARREGEDGVFSAVVPSGEWDLRLRLKDGSVVEGVDLDVPRPEGAGPLSEGDRRMIEGYIARMKMFYDKVTPLLMSGWRGRDEMGVEGRAGVLVECLRYRDYHLSRRGGVAGKKVVWRLEIWSFERLGGGWRRTRESRVLYRLAPSVDEFRRFRWYFCRGLGGVEVPEGEKDLGVVKVPALEDLPGRVGFPEEEKDRDGAVGEGTPIAPDREKKG